MDQFLVRFNLPDFKKQMAGFNLDLQQRLTRAATNAAAQAFKKAVIARAPVLKTPDTRKKNPRIAGTLRRAIYVVRARNPAPGTVEYRVGWRKGKAQRAAKGGSRDAFYGRFLELGWMPRGPGRRIKGGVRRRALERARARGAGHREVKYPFLVPGFNAARQQAVDAFNARMQKRIDQWNHERGIPN